MNSAQLISTALVRYSRIITRARTAIAYSATAIRLEVAAKRATGSTRTKLLDRAADCRWLADRARTRFLNQTQPKE